MPLPCHCLDSAKIGGTCTAQLLFESAFCCDDNRYPPENSANEQTLFAYPRQQNSEGALFN